MNNAVMTIHVQVLGKYVFISLGYTPRGAIAESYGNSMFSFLRNMFLWAHTWIKLCLGMLASACVTAVTKSKKVKC